MARRRFKGAISRERASPLVIMIFRSPDTEIKRVRVYVRGNRFLFLSPLPPPPLAFCVSFAFLFERRSENVRSDFSIYAQISIQ
jgi:hypothetical protein